MKDELFTIPPTPATPLQKARARLAKAEAEYAQAEELLECQGQEAWPRYHKASGEYQRAKDDVRIEEMRALADMRAAREP